MLLYIRTLTANKGDNNNNFLPCMNKKAYAERTTNENPFLFPSPRHEQMRYTKNASQEEHYTLHASFFHPFKKERTFTPLCPLISPQGKNILINKSQTNFFPASLATISAVIIKTDPFQ